MPTSAPAMETPPPPWVARSMVQCSRVPMASERKRNPDHAPSASRLVKVMPKPLVPTACRLP